MIMSLFSFISCAPIFVVDDNNISIAIHYINVIVCFNILNIFLFCFGFCSTIIALRSYSASVYLFGFNLVLKKKPNLGRGGISCSESFDVELIIQLHLFLFFNKHFLVTSIGFFIIFFFQCLIAVSIFFFLVVVV